MSEKKIVYITKYWKTKGIFPLEVTIQKSRHAHAPYYYRFFNQREYALTEEIAIYQVNCMILNEIHKTKKRLNELRKLYNKGAQTLVKNQ